MSEIIKSKEIDAGKKEYVKKDGTKVHVSWPAASIQMESVANHFPQAPEFLVQLADSQLLQHQVSTAYRAVGGDLDKLPVERKDGELLWFDGEVVRINPNHVFGNRNSGESKVAVLLEQCKIVAKAMKTTVEGEILRSAADKKTKQAACALLKAEG